MDTWMIMSQIKCGYTTLLEVYLQQEEARERREMFKRKIEKARAQYALTHPFSDSDTDDESYERESANKRHRPDSDGSKDDSDKQAQANKTQIINKIWSQKSNASTNEKALDKKKPADSKDACSDDSIIEVVDTTPLKENKHTVAPFKTTPTSSKRRDTRRRLKLE